MVCWLRSGIRFSTPLRACCRTLFTDVVGSYAAQSALGKIGVRTVATASTLLLGIGSLLLTQISADGSCFGDLFLGHQHRRMPGRRSTRRRHRHHRHHRPTYTNGADRLEALTGGFQAGFATCSIFAAVGLFLALTLPRTPSS
ncbi:MAG: hypothetical protein H0V13_01730 [Nocardioidaceae bacterium]|nr:hypothetical protein [Nocardioidaceae bacterium]